MRCDVFSHDLYLCVLISRGDLPAKVDANVNAEKAGSSDNGDAKKPDQNLDLGLGLGLGLNLTGTNGLTSGETKPANDLIGVKANAGGNQPDGGANAVSDKLPPTSFFDDGHRGGVGLAMDFDVATHDIDRIIERMDMVL